MRADFVASALDAGQDPLKIKGASRHVKLDTLTIYDRRGNELEDRRSRFVREAADRLSGPLLGSIPFAKCGREANCARLRRTSIRCRGAIPAALLRPAKSPQRASSKLQTCITGALNR